MPERHPAIIHEIVRNNKVSYVDARESLRDLKKQFYASEISLPEALSEIKLEADHAIEFLEFNS